MRRQGWMLMPETAQMNPVISQALRARRFARSLLTPGRDGRIQPRTGDPELFLSLEGWRLFLRVERCAYPLHQMLQHHEWHASVPAPHYELLTDEAEWERGRIESARRQLQTIGAWAVRHDCRPVVLKGGVAVLDHSGIDLNDLDILLPKPDDQRLLAALLEQGYRQCGYAGQVHLRGLQRPGDLMVEIHSGEAARGGGIEISSRAMATAPGLWRLDSVEHLWHVLTHGVLTHPPRRGRIRDLLLLGDAVLGCSPEEIELVRRRAGKHQQAELLGLALEDGLNWTRGEVAVDPFEKVALIGYLLAHRRENQARVHPTSGMVNGWVFAQLLGPAERRAMWSGTLVRAPDLSGFFPIRRLQELSPQLGRAVQVAGRVLSQCLICARAWPVSMSIRPLLRLRDTHASQVRAPTGPEGESAEG